MDLRDVNAAPISWRESGSGEAVIFLHAMVTSRAGWDPQLQTLSGDFRCIAWDMPGYGHSTPAPSDAGFDHVLATLVRFVTHTLGISRAHFVGLSVGGMILQHLAARHPDLTRSIAILGSSPKFGFSGDASGAEFLLLVREGLNAGPQARFSENMIRAIVGPKADEAAIQMAMAAMNTATREGLEFAARLIAQHDALDLLPKITCPTLVMAGAQDAETPPAYAIAIADRIAGANLSIIPSAGHISNLEAADAVTARLRTFLSHSL